MCIEIQHNYLRKSGEDHSLNRKELDITHIQLQQEPQSSQDHSLSRKELGHKPYTITAEPQSSQDHSLNRKELGHIYNYSRTTKQSRP